MKHFKEVMQQVVIKLTCDDCGRESTAGEDYEFGEFISVNHRCGFGAIHGDGKQLAVDLCQHCFASRCADVLTISDTSSELICGM